MRIIYAEDNLALKNSVVVLGNFDGVHLAHKMLVEKAVSIAKKNRLTAVVYTFSEHPKKTMGGSVEILTTNFEKEAVFETLGVDILVYQKPDTDFLNLSPENFVEKIVVGKLGAKYVVVGEHYTFGAKAKGNSEILQKLTAQVGVEACVEKLLEIDSEIVSSSKIRTFLKDGDIGNANKMLGRPFSIEGVVVHGNHLGTGIGFPTANINFDSGKIVPKYGVYVGVAQIDENEYHSIINIGVKPTIGDNAPLLEAHILDVNYDLYGKKITFKLIDYLREEKKFESLSILKDQILNDLKSAKEYFK